MNRINRLRFEIKGQVQGVGFRPHVYRVAREMGLTGWVKNNGSGVLIEITGKNTSRFLQKLQEKLPPLTKITKIKIRSLPVTEQINRFEILPSDFTHIETMISPDVGICDACLHELFDPNSRFYLYPFLSCIYCGPRLTITKNLPYDRVQTSMNVFNMCDDCANDYSDPCNRRYHAQPTACPQCGPQLSNSLTKIAEYLLKGDILAIKSLGGYQLVCDAKNEATVQILRQRKNRKSKPFALMVLNLASARFIADYSDEEARMLISRERPIVLLQKRNNLLPNIIAPGLSCVGVMLPYTPLHYLLFYSLLNRPKDFDWLKQGNSIVLIVTSANPGNAPLITEDKLARSELKKITDHIVSYNRKIVTRTDDSVIQIANKKTIFIRRARGYVPTPVKLAYPVPCTLALGAHLKNTFCITRGDEAFVSQYIGDMKNVSTIDFLHETLNHLLKFLNVKPECIACDLHPDFYTTRLARSFELPIFPIQHHHAHLAAVIAEHHIKDAVIGLALDGYGYGEDGKPWGGELFLLVGTQYQRVGHFYPIMLPGNDQAAREPWRIAAGILYELGEMQEIVKRFSNQKNVELLAQMLKGSISIIRTSSCGRLFDAASALLGVQFQSHYEGEAAMKLESLVSKLEILSEGWAIKNGQFNMYATFKHLLHCDLVTGANIFHGTLVTGLANWIKQTCQQWRTNKIVFGGGCFLNKILLQGLIETLQIKNNRVYFSEQVPPNDGGLSLGQAWIAANKKENLCA